MAWVYYPTYTHSIFGLPLVALTYGCVLIAVL